MKFVSTVSKGGKLNQIYVPKDVEDKFESGDIVEVRLLKKRIYLFYSKNLKRLSTFKERLIRDIFSVLSNEGFRQIFIVGSFLTQKVEYNDIDILVVADRSGEDVEERTYEKLTDQLNLRFHVISVNEDRLPYLLETCPLTRSMLYCYVSNKDLNLKHEKRLDKNHIRFLLMMPEDVLEINVGSHVFYDSLRRLITIERFLTDKKEDPAKANDELKELLGETLFLQLKNNEPIGEKTVKRIRADIAAKLNKTNRMIGHG